jgi:DNA-binding transcriptional MocR family regulator
MRLFSTRSTQHPAVDPPDREVDSRKVEKVAAPDKTIAGKSQSTPSPAANAAWRGRVPYNEIISLLDVTRPFNLAESTSQDLTVGEVLDLAGLDVLRGLKLGYGSSAGANELRDEIAKACKVPSEQVITTQGTALGLFLLAFETCRPGDEAVLVTPCFPPAAIASLAQASLSGR